MAISSRLLLILTALIFAAAAEAEELTLDQLIDRNVQAVGGAPAIEAVQSIRFDAHIVDPDFEIDGIYYGQRPGWMRIDIMAKGKHVYAEAFDGKRAWQWKGKGDRVDESAAATGALQHGIELPDKLFGLHEARTRGNKLELLGREIVDGVNYYVLRFTFADGVSTNLYVDPTRWLITRRRDVRALHPDIDPTPTTIESTMTDFRKVGALLFAFASTDTDLKTGKVLETSTTREITLNPKVERAFFQTMESPRPGDASPSPAKEQ